MSRLLQPFLVYTSVATDREPARQIQFLKEENRILRDRLPERITVTPRERRRLINYGKGLGPAIKELITILSPRTFARWLSGEGELRKRSKQTTRKPGRRKTPEEIRELVVRLAKETGWGYNRILDELKKLGITVARSTIVAILKEHGLDPGPKRGEGTWSEFIKRHAETLWATDFFSKKVWTKNGLVEVFVLFFIHVETRRVHIAGITENPTELWVVQQARNLSMFFAEQALAPKYLIVDLNTKFTSQFRATIENDGIEIVRVGPKKPNLNAFAERFVQSIRLEAMDHFVCFDVDHLRHIITRYETFYNQQRPHQGRENLTLPVAADDGPAMIPFVREQVGCHEVLGGLLKHYYRKAA